MRRSRLVIAAILLISLAVALAPRWWGSGGRGETMRQALQEVLSECRAAYDSAATMADTARVDSMVPMLDGVIRPGDPACGAYRQKRMFRR
jgi:type II secretory pathway pseudopilin PulG